MSKRQRREGIWHIIAAGGVSLLCGPKLGPQHFHTSRAAFEAMPKRGRCPGCERELAAYKARLEAEAS